MTPFLAWFSIVIGVGIAAVWTMDLLRGAVDLSAGVWRAREPGSGSLLWPHWLAEYGTAAALVTSGIGLLAHTGWSRLLALLGLGACAYTSINSLGWALARPDRRPYTIPMLAGSVGSLAGAILLLSQ
jgi:hypothetical protein